jgi:hypothetical protein
MYTQLCSENGMCNDVRYLYCPTLQHTCDCPITSIGYTCDCPSTMFWNSTTTFCQTRNTYLGPCPDGDYQCNEVSTVLVCRNSICQCPSANTAPSLTWFWV